MIAGVIDASFWAIGAADRLVCRVPVCRQVRDIALDILWGPAEDFDYEPITTRSAPPPA